MTAPARIRLANDSADADPWQLDLPSDPVAAAEYLRGVERSRRVELDAIVRLRRRVEGGGGDLRVPHWAAAVVAVLVIVLATLVASDAVRETGPAATASAAHAGHASMGSGIAITLGSSGATASRLQAAPGKATFILRNESDAPASLELASASGGSIATSPTVAPGERLEWPVVLDAGSVTLRARIEGSEPVDGDALTVS